MVTAVDRHSLSREAMSLLGVGPIVVGVLGSYCSKQYLRKNIKAKGIGFSLGPRIIGQVGVADSPGGLAFELCHEQHAVDHYRVGKLAAVQSI